MRPQGRGSRLAAALALALVLGGVSAQVAMADDDTDVPTRKQVREANDAVDDHTLDVEGIQQALDAANDRLEAASVAAARAAEKFNGARYEAKLARGEALSSVSTGRLRRRSWLSMSNQGAKARSQAISGIRLSTA